MNNMKDIRFNIKRISNGKIIYRFNYYDNKIAQNIKIGLDEFQRIMINNFKASGYSTDNELYWDEEDMNEERMREIFDWIESRIIMQKLIN